MTCTRYSPQGWEECPQDCPEEASVALHVNGQSWITLQCLPDDLEALAAGFLFDENIIQKEEEISLLQVCPDKSLVDIWLNHPAQRPSDWRITSGCGGAQSSANLDSKPLTKPALPNLPPLSPAAILHVVGEFLAQTELRRITGTHVSAFYAAYSTPPTEHAYAVDIGRHNTLDKLAGKLLLQNHTISQNNPGILITTGRISADMLHKAARLGTPWVVSLRSATSLALHLAQVWNIAVITHARRGGFEILTHRERLSA